jgi:hypothetical protein
MIAKAHTSSEESQKELISLLKSMKEQAQREEQVNTGWKRLGLRMYSIR